MEESRQWSQRLLYKEEEREVPDVKVPWRGPEKQEKTWAGSADRAFS